MAKNHGPTLKNDEQYEALRDKGASKQKAARIADSGSGSSNKGGKAGKYEERSMADLKKQAAKVGIEGRSKMNKSELAKALRNS